MIQALARIAGNAAKGIFAFILWRGGVATRQELLDAGYSSTIIHESIIHLRDSGLITKMGGTYRVTETFTHHGKSSSPPKESFGGEKELESSRRPKESFGGEKLEPILESFSNRKYKRKSFGGEKQSSRPPKESSRPPKLSPNPVNVNVNMILTKQANVPLIKSTSEIEGIVNSFDVEETEAFNRVCNEMLRLISKRVSGVSKDLIVRIVIAERVLGIGITAEMAEQWSKEAKAAYENKRVRESYIALSNSVKRFYAQNGVKNWTKCRPNHIRDVDRTVEKLRLFAIRTPSGEQSAADFLSFKQCDDMEKYVMGKMGKAESAVAAAGGAISEVEMDGETVKLLQLQKALQAQDRARKSNKGGPK